MWHQLKVDLPLDLPPNGDTNSLSSTQLQSTVIRALRLEHSWRKVSPVRKLTRVLHAYGNIVYQMQLLGSHWLVTLSRVAKSVNLSIWYLGDLNGREVDRIASLDMLGVSQFSAALQKGGNKIIMAVLSSDTPRRELVLGLPETTT